MPFCFDEHAVVPQVDGLESVLIVPCRFCPAASAAVRADEPYIDFPRRSFTTAAYEELIQKTKSDLESRGIRTDVFRSRLIHQFTLCMWSRQRRRRLLERARGVDAVLVLGCEAAVDTVREAVAGSGSQVIQGLRTEGIMSVQPRFSFPGTVRLELQGVSPTTFPEA